MTGAPSRDSHRKSSGFWKSSRDGAWKGQKERGYCIPSRVWAVIGSVRKGTEVKTLDSVPMPSKCPHTVRRAEKAEARAGCRQGCRTDDNEYQDAQTV